VLAGCKTTADTSVNSVSSQSDIYYLMQEVVIVLLIIRGTEVV